MTIRMKRITIIVYEGADEEKGEQELVFAFFSLYLCLSHIIFSLKLVLKWASEEASIIHI